LLEDAIGYAEDQTHNLRDFIQANLRRVVYTEPEKEAEIQNAVESLMVGRRWKKAWTMTGKQGDKDIPQRISPGLYPPATKAVLRSEAIGNT
jgi:hypothetical protein